MAERFVVSKMPGMVAGVPVPENLAKKQERDVKIQAAKRDALTKRKTKLALAKHALKLRTHAYEKEYQKEQADLVKARRDARSNGGFYRMPEPKVLFCVRIKGINKLAPKPKMILRLFRLRQIHNGVFIKVNNATKEMLKAIQPFVTFGYPSLQTIRKLVYKRGYGKMGPKGSRQRIPLQDNSIIHHALGKYGIHGIEDLIHEIYTCGPAFKYASNFLWPFKLNSPRKGFVSKRHGFQEPRGGDWGNREELINELVARMA